MNQGNDNIPIESLAQAWTVDAVDITARVAAAIETSADSQLLTELRSLRLEVAQLTRNSELLQGEVAKLRFDLMNRSSGRNAARLAPYAPSEGLVRLS